LANILLLVLSYRLMKSRIDNLKEVWRPLPILIFLTYLPAVASLMQGQDSILFLTLSLLAFVLMDHGKDLAAGAVLGIGAYRFQLLLPIFFFFVIWRRWRFVIGIIISGTLAAILSVWLVGVTATKFYVRSLAAMSIGGVTEIERLRYAQPISHMASLRALVWGIASPWLTPFWLQAVTIALSILLVFWVVRSVSASRRTSDLLPVAIVASAILSYHMLIHDMSVLLLPISVAASRAVWPENASDFRYRLILFTSALMFAAPAMIALAQFHFYLVCIPLIAFLAALLRTPAKLQYPSTSVTEGIIQLI
jgi:hypothetical protein